MKNILIISLVLWQSSTAYGQIIETDLEQKYEQALLDTAIRYELLKPVVFKMQKTHEHLNQQIISLRAENSFMHLQQQLQKTQYESTLAAEKKKRRKGNLVSFFLGYAFGKLTPPF